MPSDPPLDLALHGSLSANIAGFCRLLRSQGAKIGPGEARDALRALAFIDLNSSLAFRLALRTTLAKNVEEQQLFDVLFDYYWQVWERAHELNRQERAQPNTQNAAAKNPNAPTHIRDWLKQGEKTEEEREAAGSSAVEVRSRRDFKDFKEQEREELYRLIKAIARALANRCSRRYRPARRPGHLDMRRTMRKGLRHGGELVELAFKRRRKRRPQLVLVCDVSKSMDLYSRFLIQFVHTLQNAYRRIETFVFSTTLHRITPQLRGDDLSAALDEISLRVPEWSGGTKIGACLESLLRENGSLLDRNTALLIISDGWDTGDIELLEQSMRELKRRVRCLIWLNPLLGGRDYQPTTRGMQVALPHIDLFAPAHNLDSLRELAHYLEKLGGKKPARLPQNPQRATATATSSSSSAAAWRTRFSL